MEVTNQSSSPAAPHVRQVCQSYSCPRDPCPARIDKPYCSQRRSESEQCLDGSVKTQTHSGQSQGAENNPGSSRSKQQKAQQPHPDCRYLVEPTHEPVCVAKRE